MIPSLSVIIPTFDSASELPRALAALATQEYPEDQLEIIIADGGSLDDTVRIANLFKRQLNLQVVDNSIRREAEYGKALALQHASGDLVQFMDADMRPAGPSLLASLATPLSYDSSLAGSIARYEFSADLHVWNRFLSCDELQRDPLLQMMTPNIGDFIIERGSAYDLCEFLSPRIPPIGGTTMFRRSEIDIDRWGGHFREVDHPSWLVKQGRRLFAYVHTAGWLHDHCDGLRDLVSRRKRNLAGLQTSFLAVSDARDFVWLDRSSRSERLKLIRWLVGTNLLLPRTIEGMRDCIRLRRWEPLLRPIVALAVTDALVLELLRQRSGREWVLGVLGGSRAANRFGSGRNFSRRN